MVPGVPCMCMSTRPHSRAATRGNMPGSRPPPMSLMTSAPASRASAAVAACRVSTDRGRSVAARRASSTGSSRSCSSAGVTGSAPGRVDSPPRSSRSAPSAASSRAWATAASAPAGREPVQKLSGARLMTPMTRGRPGGSRRKRPTSQDDAEKGPVGAPSGVGAGRFTGWPRRGPAPGAGVRVQARRALRPRGLPRLWNGPPRP